MIGKILSLPFVLVAKVGSSTIWVIKSVVKLIFGIFGFFTGRIFGTVFGALLGLLLGSGSIGIKKPWSKSKNKNKKKIAK